MILNIVKFYSLSHFFAKNKIWALSILNYLQLLPQSVSMAATDFIQSFFTFKHLKTKPSDFLDVGRAMRTNIGVGGRSGRLGFGVKEDSDDKTV